MTKPKFRCFDPRPPPLAQPWGAWRPNGAAMEAKYRTRMPHVGAAALIAQRRAARGEDPNTGERVAPSSPAPDWSAIAGMALAMLGSAKTKGWRKRLT